MNEILKKLNSRKYSNKKYTIVNHNNLYVVKQYINGTENIYFDVKYTSKADVIEHLKNILEYDI